VKPSIKSSLEIKDLKMGWSRPFWTLFKKEVIRFFDVSVQALIAPTISASLYLLIFGVSLGKRIGHFEGLSFAQFVVPGLVLMGVVTNSFLNTSSSLFFSRYLGYVVDMLVTPLSSSQIIFAYTLAAMLRGILVGSAVYGISLFFTSLPWVHPLHAILMLLLTSFLFAQLGLIAAIYSDTFEQLNMFNSFLLMPLIFLGGVFYPVTILPEFWQKVSWFNPLFYLIDGFRQSLLGIGDSPMWLDLSVSLGLSVVLFIWAALLIRSGYKLRN